MPRTPTKTWSKWQTKAKVSDQWYPNYPGDMVRIAVGWLDQKPYPAYICVWGGDDFGMEQWFNCGSRGAAVRKYRELIKLAEWYRDHAAPLSAEFFKKEGFVQA